MFGLMTIAAHDAVVAAKDAEIAELREGADADWARLDELLLERDLAYRQLAHHKAEAAQLERDVAGLLPDAERYRAGVKRLADANERRRVEAMARRGSGSAASSGGGMVQ